jgi:hypothetical protein
MTTRLLSPLMNAGALRRDLESDTGAKQAQVHELDPMGSRLTGLYPTSSADSVL